MQRIIKIVSLCGLVFVLMLLTTNPNRLPSIFLIIPFLLLFLCLWLGSLGFFGSLLGMTRKKAMRLSVTVAVIPTSMLVLQSIGQLTVRDAIIISVLFCIVYFYLSRFFRTSNER